MFLPQKLVCYGLLEEPNVLVNAVYIEFLLPKLAVSVHTLHPERSPIPSLAQLGIPLVSVDCPLDPHLPNLTHRYANDQHLHIAYIIVSRDPRIIPEFIWE